MRTLLRWIIAIPLTIAGCWVYFASALIGGGMHSDPMPGWGMLIAGVALLTAIGGYWLIRSQRGERIVGFLINVALVLGAVSLVYGLVRWGYEMIYRVQSSEWGHSRPGELLFRISYGTLSALSFVIFNIWVRKPNTITIPTR